jgi:hypothetical protein
MAEHSDKNNFGPQEPAGCEVVPEAGPALETPAPHSTYLKLIDTARKTVAVAMAVCGVGLVICVNREDYLRLTLRRESGIWTWGCWVFGIGVLACLTATLALIVEYLARPAKPRLFTLRSLFVRSLLIVIAVVAVCLSMAFAYGPWQAIGAVIGTFLVLAAAREHRIVRVVLAILAAIMLGLTLLGTQSAYQYARRHADEIVAAGCELMDHCPKTGYYTYNRHPEIDTSGILALFGQEIQPGDPRVPSVLRKLGARRIWIDEERVAVYVGPNKFDFSCIPQPEIEFQIYRDAHPTTTCGPVWGDHGKGATRITDRLWTNVY